jgi:uncharacterized protein (UPF0548 family)
MSRRRALSDRLPNHEAKGASARGAPNAELHCAGDSGYRWFEATARIGDGPSHWSFAADAVLRWGVKTRSGFTVESERGDRAGQRPVAVGERYWLVAHVGPLRIREPVEVVWVVDEQGCRGFAYGTLSGHPVSGEEAFLVERRADGSVWITIRSMSGPASGPWRFAFPALMVAQRVYRRRYLRALAQR